MPRSQVKVAEITCTSRQDDVNNFPRCRKFSDFLVTTRRDLRYFLDVFLEGRCSTAAAAAAAAALTTTTISAFNATADIPRSPSRP